ncbi:MAG: lytic transglycosylase domain-containing protein [Deltaproteobacteria bacterium]|nr:lytic transglycosylase domain-containing protein [Deltaproteobacteria bacterium]
MTPLLSICLLAALLSPAGLGPPRLDLAPPPVQTLPAPGPMPGAAPKYPSLHARRREVYDRAVDFIRGERFQEALSLVRRQPPELREWPGISVLEAGLVSVSDPGLALDLYYKIINQKVRDRHWARAAAGYRLVLARLSDGGDYGARARLIRGLGLEWRNNEAREILERTLEEPGLPGDVRDELLAFRAVLALRVGDFQSAGDFWRGRKDLSSLRWFSTLRLREAKFSEAAEARLQAALLLRGQNRLRELDRTLDIMVKGGLGRQAEDLLKEYPDLKKRVPDWGYRLGLAWLIGGDPAKAAGYFGEEENRKGGRRKASLYYRGRALETAGDKAGALKAYRQAAAGALDYYRLLAEGRLAKLGGLKLRVPLAEPMARLLDGPWEDRATLGYHLWLTERLPWPWPELEAVPRPGRDLAGDMGKALASMEHFLGLGNLPAAYEEMAAAGEGVIPEKTSQDDPSARRYVYLAALSGDYRLAVSLMSRLAPPKGFSGQRWNHPLVLGRPVLRAWRSKGLSPQLVLSVIRTESAFQSEVVSSSNARGLMQILPSTAARIAEREGGPPPREEDLFNPELNVRYGTGYLADLVAAFGSTVLALAAYNGGPFNIKAYMEALPKRPLDLFVETLPFSESSSYVRRVLESQARYEAAYLGRYNLGDFSVPVGLPPGTPPDF